MMFEDAAMLWNGVLTIAIGAFLWWIRGTNSQIANLIVTGKHHCYSS